MEYSKWKDDGSGMVSQPPVHKTSDATIKVKSLRLPKISITKDAADGSVVTLGGKVVYKVGITNKGDVDFVNPVILDMLPTGVTFDDTYDVEIDSAPPHGQNEEFKIDVETRVGNVTQTYQDENGTEMGDAETAVIFKLKGKNGADGIIKPGSTIFLYFRADIAESAGMYKGDTIENDVFASTAERSYHTTDNPYGFGFTDAGGNIPGTLDEAAEDLSPVADKREGGLHEALGSYAYNDSDGKPIEYVWVPAKAEVTYSYASGITLKKAVWGDRDAGYEESQYFLAMSTRTNVPDDPATGTSPLDYTDPPETVQNQMGTVGWTKWRLTVDNGSKNALTRITIGDIIPKQNDGRLSSWESVWRKILAVQNGDTIITEGTGTNTYTVFFYVGDEADVVDKYDSTGVHVTQKGALTKALEETGYWNTSNHTISKPTTDTNWKTRNEITDYRTIKAFIIVFDKDLVFAKNTDLVVSYQTTVANMTDGTQFNNEYAYQNDNNIFRMNFRNSMGPLTSNQVSVTLMDKPVSVEGDLWIDEDWDGVQNKGRTDGKAIIAWDPEETRNGNRRDYSEYKIIKELTEATKYTITDLRAGQGTSEADLGLQEGAYIGYGESVEHFRFDELIPGAITYKYNETDPNSQLYIYDADGNLKKEGLRTFDPAMYKLNVEVRNNPTLLSILKITKKGTNYYRSNNPDIHDFTEDINNYVLDDNFFNDGTSNSVFVTKPFFIRYSTEVDKTKDWGVQLFRDLVIEKQALDNSNVKIEGVEFEIYGPYGDSSMPAGENSTISERTEDVLSGDPLSFSLTDGVYHLVRKEGDKYFREKDDEEVDADTIKTKLVTGEDGKINVSGLNWWKEYDIKETKPAEGYVIDGAVATADGSVGTQIEDRGNGVFTLKVPSTTKTSAMGADQVIVEDPRPVKLTPLVTKQMSGDSAPLPEAKTFKFELTATDVVNGGCYYWKDKLIGTPTKKFVSDGTGGTTATKWEREIELAKGARLGEVSFDELHFIKTGEYKFELIEIEGNDEHIVYYPYKWTYTVNVTHDPATNKLVATGSWSTAEPNPPAPTEPASAIFTNKYTPEPVDAEVKVKKELDGRVWLNNEEFEFTITPVAPGEVTPVEGDPAPATAPAFSPSKVTIKNTDAPNYTKSFGTVRFEKAGTYTWKVSETKKDPAGGITFAADQIVTIVIVDDGKGHLIEKGKPRPIIDSDNYLIVKTAELKNEYDASGSIGLKGTKKFKYGIFGDEDSNDPRKKNFTFSVYQKTKDCDAVTVVSGKDLNTLATIDELQAVKVGSASTSNARVGTDGTAVFDFKFKSKGGTAFDKDKLEYTLDDIKDGDQTEAGLKTKTFEYVLVEDIPATAVKKTVDGVTFYYDKTADIKYDPTVYVVTITVTDNGDGTLDVKTSDNVVTYGFVNEKLYTKIRLTKKINSLVTGDTTGEEQLTNVTCVFKVTYLDPILTDAQGNRRKVSRTVSVQFDATNVTAETATLDKIPLDADVQVEEVYAADYEGNTETALARLEIDPDTNLPMWTATFKNKRKGDVTGGSVINEMGNNGNGFVITNRRQRPVNNTQPPDA